MRNLIESRCNINYVSSTEYEQHLSRRCIQVKVYNKYFFININLYRIIYYLTMNKLINYSSYKINKLNLFFN